MQETLTIIGVIIGALALTVAYLQLVRTPRNNKQKSGSNKESNLLFKKVMSTKSIRVGYFHYPPFMNVLKDTDTPSGFFPMVIEEVAKANSIKVIWQYVDFSDAVQKIKNDEVDIIASIFQTPKRTATVDFTAFLHSIAVSGVAKKSINDLHSQADLVNSNLSIVVSKEEIGHELVEVLKISRNRVTIIDTDDLAKIVSYVEIGLADVALLDGVSIINYFENVAKNRNFLKPIFRRRPLTICLNGIMLPQNEPELANWLDQQCKKIRKKEHIRYFEEEFLEKYNGVINKL